MLISITVDPPLEIVNIKHRRGFVLDVTCSQHFFSVNSKMYREIYCSRNSSVVIIIYCCLKVYFHNQLKVRFSVLSYLNVTVRCGCIFSLTHFAFLLISGYNWYLLCGKTGNREKLKGGQD